MRIKDYLSELEQYFELIKIIGYGGMGLCYLAKNFQDQKLYALKVLHPDWRGHKEAQQQLRKEALIEQLFQTHVHIVQTYRFIEFESFGVKIMEFMQGMPLKQYLLSQIKIDKALLAEKIFKHISDALQTIHQHGIVHHDIKPANIFMESSGNVKLFDFGIAKAKQNKNDLIDIHHLRELTRTILAMPAAQFKQ